MDITRSNYEIYVVDYLEGRLTAHQVAALLLFLEENPDLREEVDMLGDGNMVLPRDNTVFTDKTRLYQPAFNEIRDAWDEKLAARLEGDWSMADERAFKQALQAYPELEHEAALMEKTRLQPDMQVVYPGKRSLKRKTVAFPLYGNMVRWSVAAALLASICFWWMQQSAPVTPPVAQKQQEKEIHQPLGPSLAQSQSAQSGKNILPKDIAGSTAEKSAIRYQSTAVNDIPVTYAKAAQHPVSYMPLPAKLPPVVDIDPLEIPLYAMPIAYMQPVHMPADYQMQVDEFNTLGDLIEQRLANSAKQVLVEENAPTVQTGKSRFQVKDIGLLAVRVYNKATGSDVQVKRRYDNQGNVVVVGVVSASASFEMYRSHR